MIRPVGLLFQIEKRFAHRNRSFLEHPLDRPSGLTYTAWYATRPPTSV